jgi:tRNA(Ile)-lysidine synthase
MSRTELESSLWKTFLPFQKTRLLVAFSGGRDSVVLAEGLSRVAESLHLGLGLAHIHHGLSVTSEQTQFRDSALEFSKNWAQTRHWPFFFAKPEPTVVLQSEAACRDFRHRELERIREQHGYDFVVYAHHANDLLETRLLRLLRGTGGRGLKAMQLRSRFKLRPLLKHSTYELQSYALLKKLRWLEDPSNLQLIYLRNWLRQQWLPQLETQCPGATRALSRSLEQLSQDLSGALNPSDDLFHPAGGLNRQKWVDLSKVQKQNLLHAYFQKLQWKDFSAAQIDEIIKRLSTVQKKLTFKTAGLSWTVNAQRIFAEA